MQSETSALRAFVLERLFPKERDFFPIFDEISGCLAKTISELLSAVESPEIIAKAIENTKELQKQTDRLVRQSVEHLHESFITPFDRIHIFRFVTTLGEIVGQTLLVTQKLQDYGIHRLPLESVEIIVRCGEACTLVRKMVHQLKKIKSPDDTVHLCLRIYRLSSESKVYAFQATKTLFAEENDWKTFVKLKEINEDLVAMIRKFKSISYLIEEIIIEYA
jgi:uncharacterized protein Yka (UPF0111/DUF47 family)